MDTFGVRTLAKFFNVDFRVVTRWIEKFDMPCEKKTYNGINHYDIDLEEFWKWAYKHRDIINWSKYDRGTLPLEPEWVLTEKNNYKPGKSRSRWTRVRWKQKAKLKRFARTRLTVLPRLH